VLSTAEGPRPFQLGTPDRHSAGCDDEGVGVVGADVGVTPSGGVDVSRAVGDGGAAGGDGDGNCASEAVGRGIAGDGKRHFTLRRSAFARRKKATPVVSSGQPHILGLWRLLTTRVLRALVH